MHATKNGREPAVIFEDQTISWYELWQKVEMTSRFFANQLSPTDQEVVDILMTNSIDFIITYLGVIHAGHIALLLDPAYKGLELNAFINQIPPALIVTEGQYMQQIDEPTTRVVTIDDLLNHDLKIEKLLRLPPEVQIASLTFTSGTTGTPKAVPNTHTNHIWNIETCSKVWDWTSKDTLLVSLPLSHMHGIVICMSGSLYHGNTIYLQRWFDEQATMETLGSGKISLFTHAASAYVKLVQMSNHDYDLSGVRLCISGAAPLPPAVWQEFKNRFGIEILETYGTSETGRIAGNRLHERVLGSPGRPLPGVDLRISKEGEVEVKSKGVFPGYYKNPAATAAGFTKDGFWRTGDMAELKDGYVYLKGRQQERIRRFGYTVSPRDVEWAMLKHPKIQDIYVMGRQIPGEPKDELLYFIVSDLSDEEIIDYSKTNLLFAWRPDRIVHVNELPRTRSGKVSLREVRKLAEVKL